MEALTDVEARVVACLVEKQHTVPDTYPLSLNALLTACNQTSNRDPILHLVEGDVVRAIDALKAKGMARIVHPGAGSRTTKYRHVLDDALGLEEGPLAVLTVLLLRGAQTSAELRARTERLHPFADLGAVEDVLESLAADDDPLVRRLDRRPGEREARWIQLLTPDASGHETASAPARQGVTTTDTGVEARVAALEDEMADLRSVVERLRDLLDE